MKAGRLSQVTLTCPSKIALTITRLITGAAFESPALTPKQHEAAVGHDTNVARPLQLTRERPFADVWRGSPERTSRPPRYVARDQPGRETSSTPGGIREWHPPAGNLPFLGAIVVASRHVPRLCHSCQRSLRISAVPCGFRAGSS
jgi:hypothetical protein